MRTVSLLSLLYPSTHAGVLGNFLGTDGKCAVKGATFCLKACCPVTKLACGYIENGENARCCNNENSVAEFSCTSDDDCKGIGEWSDKTSANVCIDGTCGGQKCEAGGAGGPEHTDDVTVLITEEPPHGPGPESDKCDPNECDNWTCKNWCKCFKAHPKIVKIFEGPNPSAAEQDIRDKCPSDNNEECDCTEFHFGNAKKEPEVTAPSFFEPQGDVYVYDSSSTCNQRTNMKDGTKTQCCGSATAIVIDASVTVINEYAFYKCHSVKSVDLSQATNLVTVSKSAFRYMKNLEAIDFSNTKISSIGKSAFSYTSKLHSLALPSDTLMSVGPYAFFNTNLLEKHDVEWNGVNCEMVTATDDTDTVWPFSCVDSYYTYTKYTTCTYATNGNAPCCGSATVIKIDDTVTEIKAGAFQGCEKVQRVDTTTATSLTAIGSLAFQKANSLYFADLSGATKLKVISNEAFYDCKKLTNVKLPPSITKIASHAFFYNGDGKLASASDVDFNGVDCGAVTKGSTQAFKFICPNVRQRLAWLA